MNAQRGYLADSTAAGAAGGADRSSRESHFLVDHHNDRGGGRERGRSWRGDPIGCVHLNAGNDGVIQIVGVHHIKSGMVDILERVRTEGGSGGGRGGETDQMVLDGRSEPVVFSRSESSNACLLCPSNVLRKIWPLLPIVELKEEGSLENL
jgi:hypothetical protein